VQHDECADAACPGLRWRPGRGFDTQGEKLFERALERRLARELEAQVRESRCSAGVQRHPPLALVEGEIHGSVLGDALAFGRPVRARQGPRRHEAADLRAEDAPRPWIAHLEADVAERPDVHWDSLRRASKASCGARPHTRTGSKRIGTWL
jgi:hypothetical protein